MCGVSGIYSPVSPFTPAAVESIRRMNVAQKNRGPNGDGVWGDPSGHCILGHTRLAILDLSEAGRQPMSNNDGSVVVSFNGEIYNHKELRAELENHGYEFHSKTDTEVLLHGYQEFGIHTLAYVLRGMFAFALYDVIERTLFLVRDRLGIKPLYWRRIGDGLAFASTVKALLAAGWPVTENQDALASFIRWGSVVGNQTTVKEIEMLPPATIMKYDAYGHTAYQYWKIEDFLPSDDLGRAHDIGIIQQVRSLLEETISRHLQSDVPVGVFLSGGVDSSVLAKMSKCEGVVVGYDDCAELDESRFATQIAACHGVSLTYESFEEEFPKIIHAMDQPSIDGVNTWFAAQTARHYNFPVALSGLGADELFAGYKHLQRTWSPYWLYRSVFKPWQIRRMVDTDDVGFLNVANATYAEFTRYLHDQLLRDCDWASMAHGVEVRVPYLDHKLVEAILPISMKLKCQSHKYLLIEAVKDLLPRAVWDRPKMGFTLPMERWLKQDADHWQAMAMEQTPLKRSGVEWTWKQFRKGRLHWSRAWATVICSQWKQFV